MRMASVKYQSGDTVMGRWPGSSLYYEVKVLRFDSKSQLYTVIYKDGTELELREADIRSELTFRTARSRSRSRSPSRRRSRSRSPARTTRRASSRTAIITTETTSRQESSRKETTPAENNRKNAAEEKEVDTGNNNAVNQQVEAELEKKVEKKVYNLRRRKDDGDAKPAEESKQEETQQEEKPKLPAAPTPSQLEFGGRIGVLLLMLLLPVAVMVLVLMAGQEDASLLSFAPTLPNLQELCDGKALAIVALWISLQALLYALPIGKVVEGLPLQSGERLKYRTNGLVAFLLTALGVGVAVHQEVDLTYVHSNFLQLATATLLLSVLLSLYLYARARKASPQDLAPGGNSGYLIYDFFMGRELNPRIRTFDLKFFFEMRPGLIGWLMVNFCLALAEMKLQGLDSPSPAMILVNAFQMLYIVDAFWNEEGILSYMDIIHEGFGFMLAFGDLVWVPFTYSLQALYLVNHPNPLSYPWLAAIITIKAVGYYIFRQSNSEKNSFRRNPSDPKLTHLKTIPTATGKSLLVSGWWGVVRHPNYLGDLIMALAWSLPCGFNHILPYFYLIYFLVLLVHREARDDAQCRRKYGSAWDDYCRAVPYRIFPKIY